MKYNFDEVIDRSNNRSSKYDEDLRSSNRRCDPIMVADMDFKTAQPIIDACKKKAEEGIWDILPDRQATLKQYRNGKKNIMAGSLKLPT